METVHCSIVRLFQTLSNIMALILKNLNHNWLITIRKVSSARIATTSSSTSSIPMLTLATIFVNNVASTDRLSLMHYRICSLSLRILRISGFKAKTTTSILVAFTTFTMPWQLFPLQDSLEFNRM